MVMDNNYEDINLQYVLKILPDQLRGYIVISIWGKLFIDDPFH